MSQVNKPYEYIIILICPAALRTVAGTIAAQQSLNPNDNTPLFFGREVRNTTTGLTTHYLARTIAFQDTIDALPGLVTAMPGANWHIEKRRADSELEAAARLSLSDWLLTLGLELVPEEPLGIFE